MATLKDYNEEEGACLIECVIALKDITELSIVDICNETGLTRESVKG